MVCPFGICNWTCNCFGSWCFDSLTSTCTSLSGMYLLKSYCYFINLNMWMNQFSYGKSKCQEYFLLVCSPDFNLLTSSILLQKLLTLSQVLMLLFCGPLQETNELGVIVQILYCGSSHLNYLLIPFWIPSKNRHHHIPPLAQSFNK